MRNLTTLFLIGFLVPIIFGCGGSPGERDVESGDDYLPISAEILPGTWSCTRYVLGTGIENEMMAGMQGDLEFTENEVVYMQQTYSYSIEDDRVIITQNGQEILRPLAWDGESLIMLGDDAKVYYEKQ